METLRFLIISTVLLHRAGLESILDQAGHETVLASGFDHALELSQSGDFDLAIICQSRDEIGFGETMAAGLPNSLPKLLIDFGDTVPSVRPDAFDGRLLYNFQREELVSMAESIVDLARQGSRFAVAH